VLVTVIFILFTLLTSSFSLSLSISFTMSTAGFVTELETVVVPTILLVASTPVPSQLIPVCDELSAPCNSAHSNSIGATIDSMDVAPGPNPSATTLSFPPTSSSSVDSGSLTRPAQPNLLGLAIGTFVLICVVLIGGLWFLLRRRNRTKDDEEIANFTPYPFAMGISGNGKNVDGSGRGNDTPEKEHDEKDSEKEQDGKEHDGKEHDEKDTGILASLPTLAKHS